MAYKEKLYEDEIIPMGRLVQIVLCAYGQMEFKDIVEHISDLTRFYYRRYYPPEQNLKNLVSKALRVLHAYHKVKRIKRGVWEITKYGMEDLANYHRNVRKIPDEILPYDVKVLAELMG